MDKLSLSSLPNLTDAQQAILAIGNVGTVAELVLAPSKELAKRCRVSPLEITRLVQVVCQHQASQSFTFTTLEGVDDNQGKTFTTGDSVLDHTIGGGIRPGMIWEVVGESAAGKTQFALQSCLYVQLPQVRGGLGGSACYLTTSTQLQTARLVQIQQSREILDASLEDVHTLSTPTVHGLLNVLEIQLPIFIERMSKTLSRKPIKLLVIDALAELFHLVEKTSTASLVERSQQLIQVSFLLHRLAHRHHIAIIILNEVADAFDNYAVDFEKRERGLLLYAEQARWFNRGHTLFGENKKEAALGLVWANQVNARIMLSRTARRRYVNEANDVTGRAKRHRKEEEGNDHESRMNNPAPEEEPSLIRRLTVIFNSAAPRTFCDYIVTGAGVKGLPSEEKSTKARVHYPSEFRTINTQPQPSSDPPAFLPQPQIRRLLVDSPAQPQLQPQVQVPVGPQTIIPSSQDEEYDSLWTDEEYYDNVDWYNLELTLRESQQVAQ